MAVGGNSASTGHQVIALTVYELVGLYHIVVSFSWPRELEGQVKRLLVYLQLQPFIKISRAFSEAAHRKFKFGILCCVDKETKVKLQELKYNCRCFVNQTSKLIQLPCYSRKTMVASNIHEDLYWFRPEPYVQSQR